MYKEKKRKLVKKSRISGPDGMGPKKDGLVESNPKKKSDRWKKRVCGVK